jgi:hypothetical protein
MCGFSRPHSPPIPSSLSPHTKEEPAEELRICTLCNKVLKKRRVPAHLRDKRHLAAVEVRILSPS